MLGTRLGCIDGNDGVMVRVGTVLLVLIDGDNEGNVDGGVDNAADDGLNVGLNTGAMVGAKVGVGTVVVRVAIDG